MKNCAYIVTNKMGFTLLEALIAVAMISIISLGMAGFSLMGEQATRKNSLSISAMSFRNTLLTTIENSRAWENTVNHNAEMSCLKTFNPCPQNNNFKPITIYDENNILFYDSENAVMGFNLAGKPCASYPGVNSDCKLRFDVKWKIICPVTGACTNPLVQVAAEVVDAPEIKPQQQTELRRLSFEVYKSFAQNTIQASCEAVGGTYEVDSQSCKALISERCPSGQVVVAVNAVGGLTCRSPLTGQCGAGQVLVGFSEEGFPVCNNLVAQLTPPEDSGSGSGSDGSGSDGGGSDGGGSVVLTSVPVGAAVPGETQCHQQLRASAASVNKSSSQDLVFYNLNQPIDVDSARSVDIYQIAAPVTVHWAQNVQRLEQISGPVYLIADLVPNIAHLSNSLCLLARHVENIVDQSNDIEIDADSIGSIHMTTGNITIHRAQVGSVSMSNGNICLQSGAKILDTSDIELATFNCP